VGDERRRRARAGRERERVLGLATRDIMGEVNVASSRAVERAFAVKTVAGDARNGGMGDGDARATSPTPSTPPEKEIEPTKKRRVTPGKASFAFDVHDGAMPFAHDERGEPMFGCETCSFDPDGCEKCLGGPPIRTTWVRERALAYDVPPVKTYRPTEEEWAGDPLEYINSIRPEAEKYGVCNIIPPPSWTPEFCLPDKESLRFRTRIQALNELQNRPAGPSARARAKMLEEEGDDAANVSASTSGRMAGGGGGGRMGGGGGGGRMGGATPEDVEAVVKQYGFQQGARHNLTSLERYSKYFKSTYFSEHGEPQNVSVKDMEGEFWRLIEASEGRNVEVIYGADIATMHVGSGFAKAGVNCPPGQETYASSPWNVCNMPYNSESCLSHVEATTGITVPWLYFGMTMSAFCWHVEDHSFYSVNYHHFGAPKVWYSIPATHSKQFEEVMHRRLPHLFQSQPDLLHSLVTILSPKILQDEGIPVYRVEQHPRSYIITFPYAYHAGFNTGFNCAEAVNFAPIDWLPFGVGATERYVRDKRYQSVAHDQLLSTLTQSAHKHPRFPKVLAEVMQERVDTEEQRVEGAKPLIGQFVRMENTAEAPDLNERDCTTCKADLNWAGVACSCSFGKGRGYVYCLRCVKACECAVEKRTCFYRHTVQELREQVSELRRLAAGTN